MGTGFHCSWRLDRMPTQGPDARRVDAIARDGSFWAKLNVVCDLGQDIDVERSWMQGCPCHEEECIEHARKGMTFKCPNNRKSCRGPQIRQRLQDTFARWRDNHIALRTTSDDDPTGEIYSAVHAAYSHLLGVAKHKFKFLDHLPYRFWEARDPAIARELLGLYRRGVVDGSQHHRVAVRWCEGDLSADFIDHCEGRGMSSRLDAEIKALEYAKFDGASAEAVHGQLARIATASTGSSFRFKASGVRLNQNLTEYDLYCSLGWADKLHAYWNKHKAALQSKTGRRGALVPKRVSDAAYCAQVYRYGWHSQQDWSELRSHVSGQPRARRAQASMSFAKIKKYFISSLIKPRQLYSVRTHPDKIEQARSSTAIYDGESGDAVRELEVFEVIGMNPNGKRVPEAYDTSSMFCPAMIRKWVLHGAGPWQQTPAHLTLQPSRGDPTIMDVTAMTSWVKLRDSLHMWAERRPSDVDGCLDAAKPVHWNGLIPLPWDPGTCPALAMLGRLKDEGWTEGNPDHHRLPIDDKKLNMKDVVARKSYLLCLLDAASLQDRGCDAIYAGQVEQYYRCLLNVDPNIPPNRGADFYRRALKSGGCGSLADVVIDADGVGVPIHVMGAAVGARPAPLPPAGGEAAAIQVFGSLAAEALPAGSHGDSGAGGDDDHSPVGAAAPPPLPGLEAPAPEAPIVVVGGFWQAAPIG
ncbi:unnamed protein product [Prorocentrum cordatum]|uniref:Uncharacterized protein n=1 Tax=Prorocentrum cordatum TaxID=2364126 RepID=A0ABN9VRW5_9DINO|nr:unnamed protein product [Polarella glacialis]